MRIFLGTYFHEVRKRFFDGFTRGNQSGLGIADDGSSWNILTGAFSVASSKATTTSAGSTATSGYALATVDMANIDNAVELKGTTPGSSAAIWVQSASDWWMVSQESSSYSYSYTYTTVTGTQSWSVPSGQTYTYNYVLYGSYTFPSYVPSYAYLGYAQGDIYSTFTYNTYGSATGTGTASNYLLKLYKAVAGTVSSVTTLLTSASAVIQSFRVKTSSNAITVQAYSDTNLTTQIGATTTYNATTPTLTSKYGISLHTSAANQGYVVADSVNITKNP